MFKDTAKDKPLALSLGLRRSYPRSEQRSFCFEYLSGHFFPIFGDCSFIISWPCFPFQELAPSYSSVSRANLVMKQGAQKSLGVSNTDMSKPGE